ncbi:hypothetical protein EUGRSUZ_L03226 [Eucalyptus grandis]|uniref:Uncharacterized protein n=1 Tax=Eucalyptus grandis TaxID=71139 RepID=A0AAD9WGT3_EUCGR|nr:hypothetical protein EUGRSUZ_L03226 [Eucalyptus grandis]
MTSTHVRGRHRNKRNSLPAPWASHQKHTADDSKKETSLLIIFANCLRTFQHHWTPLECWLSQTMIHHLYNFLQRVHMQT